MVNIFDNVNKVAEDLRETPQYKNLGEALKAVNANADAKDVFERFQKAQASLNQSMQSGQEPTEDQIKEWQAVAGQMDSIEELKTLAEAEQAMNQLLMQVNETITGPISDLYR